MDFIFYYYLLLHAFEYVYLKFDSVFICFKHAFDIFHLIHCRIYNFRCRLIKQFNIDAEEILEQNYVFANHLSLIV